MEHSDWIENLITCVEKRPALYDKKKREYSDRNVKDKLWQEVCQTLVPKWNELTAQEQAIKGKDIQRKWQNLRSCFKRELRLQKTTKSGAGKVKRRKYVYFDQLLFLLPTLEDRETVSDVDPVEQHEEDSLEDGDAYDTVNDEERYESTPSEITSASQASIAVPSVQRSKKRKVSFEESLLHILQEKKQEIIDEDKTFLLSLVPTMKKLTDDQKFQVKMEFLQVLRRVQAVSPIPPSPTANMVARSIYSTTHPYDYRRPSNVLPNPNIGTSLPCTITHQDYGESGSSCSYVASPYIAPSPGTMGESNSSDLLQLH